LKKPPQRDPEAAYVRKAIAARRIGGRKCACGEERPRALIPKSRPTICAECKRKKGGRTTLDDHHPAGETNDPTTLPVPVNDHRAELSPSQCDWPRDTLENPEGSPLLADAARIRGFTDTSVYLAEKLLLPTADSLEKLNSTLVNKLGPRWWRGTESEQPTHSKRPRPHREPK
jgi:hypothetical protein